MPCIWEDASGDGRTGRLGFVSELKERIRETVSDTGAAALVDPAPDLP